MTPHHRTRYIAAGRVRDKEAREVARGRAVRAREPHARLREQHGQARDEARLRRGRTHRGEVARGGLVEPRELVGLRAREAATLRELLEAGSSAPRAPR